MLTYRFPGSSAQVLASGYAWVGLARGATIGPLCSMFLGNGCSKTHADGPRLSSGYHVAVSYLLLHKYCERYYSGDCLWAACTCTDLVIVASQTRRADVYPKGETDQ